MTTQALALYKNTTLCSAAQADRFGNKCFHDKNNPKFYLPPAYNKNRPSEFHAVIEKLKRVFFQPNSRFVKQINATHPKKRKKRSERLEAIIAVAQALVHYCEAWLLCIGKFNDDGGFEAYDCKFIAAKAGITLVRAKRALSDLVKAGYLLVKRRFDKHEDGSYSGLAALRFLSIGFFMDLGINYQALWNLRDWKRKRIEKAQMKAAKHKGNYFLGGLIKKAFSRRKNKVSTQNPTPAKQLPEQLQKDLATLAMDMHQANPSRSITDYYKELLAKHQLE